MVIAKTKKNSLICFSILFICFFLVCLRCFLGFDWSDETYYLALPYRFINGDQYFLHSWDLHQLSAMLLVPLVQLYLLIVGSTDSIILCFRLLFTVMQFLVVLLAFSIFKKRFSIFASLLVSLCYLFFTPSNIQNFSYNTFSLHFLFLSILFFYMEKRIFLFLSGVFFAFAVQCYPFLIIFVPFTLISIIILLYRTPDRRRILTRSLLFFGGCTLVFVIFCFTIFEYSSFSALIKNFPYLISDAEHPSRGLIQPMFDYIVSYCSYSPILCMSSFLLVFILIILKLKKKLTQPKIQKIFFIIPLVLLIGSLIRTFFVMDVGVTQAHLFLIPFALTGPVFFLTAPTSPSIFRLSLLWGSGILFSIAVSYGTNNSFTFYSYPFIFCTIAVILLVSQRLPQTMSFALPIKISFYSIACCFLLILFSLRMTIIYRDAPLSSLSTQLQGGPASHLLTTHEQQQKYQDILDAFTYIPQDGTILFTKLLPFGYLSTTATPASPSVWRTSLKSERLMQYYRLYPDKLPDCVFIVKEDYGITNENNPLNCFFENYLKNFRIIEHKSAIIYIKPSARETYPA